MGVPGEFLGVAFLCSASILLFGIPYAIGGASMDYDLHTYKWKNRIILIFAPSTDSDIYKRQMRRFEGQEDSILDRDLIIIELFEEIPVE